MNKPLVLNPLLLKQLAALQKQPRAEALLALIDLCEAFGRPYVHAGLGVRKAGAKLFECRAGLRLRILFTADPETITAHRIGDHDEVKQWFKSRIFG